MKPQPYSPIDYYRAWPGMVLKSYLIVDDYENTITFNRKKAVPPVQD